MIQKSLSDISPSDITALIGAAPEGRTLEYKRSLPGTADQDKREFLADVSSFANTLGGDIIFGVSESEGLPTAVVGLPAVDIDTEILRLESLIRTGVAPRIQHHFARVACGPAQVLVLRVDRSWLGPHRVTFRGHDKFYARSSAGKYDLDVAELRTAFLRTDVAAAIREFREQRLIEIGGRRTPVPLRDAPARLVLHFLPVDAFANGHAVDLSPIYQEPSKMPPIMARSWTHRITLEGVATYCGLQGGAVSYVHLYRSGVLEVVTTETLINPRMPDDEGNVCRIPSVLFERELLRDLHSKLTLQSALGVAPPIYVFLSLLGVRGYRMTTGDSSDLGEEIDRDALLLPETVVESFPVDVSRTFRSVIDLVWNACGFRGSPNFDSNGSWRQPR